jgi:hypothetical protein
MTRWQLRQLALQFKLNEANDEVIAMKAFSFGIIYGSPAAPVEVVEGYSYQLAHLRRKRDEVRTLMEGR